MAQLQKHILVIRLSAMGDVAISVPVIRALLNQHPNLKITFLSKGHLEPLFMGLDNLIFVIADVKGEHSGILGLYRLYRQLKNKRFYAIADLHDVLRSKILRFFFRWQSVKTCHINKGRADKKALTRSSNKVFKQLKSSSERYADVFRELGFKLDLSKPKFPPKYSLDSLNLPQIQSKNGFWVGIAPFAQYPSKVYPLDLLEKLMNKLLKDNRMRLFMFGGGQKEIDLINSLSKKYENIISVAGKISFNDELKLISNLDCMLSMDSANAHLAAMHGVSTVSLWGITHPYAGFAPFNQPESYSVLPDLKKYSNIPCSVYGNKVCEGYENVMRSIDPDKVSDLILEICQHKTS